MIPIILPVNAKKISLKIQPWNKKTGRTEPAGFLREKPISI
jgi:hypothetical protein